jgi:toxin ParE1/3/4
MAGFLVSHPARADINDILARSAALWGYEAQSRYTALLLAGMQAVADQPDGPLTRDCRGFRPGIRSFHLRHVRKTQTSSGVKQPVHLLYYRIVSRELIEIVRVLHERMDPNLHLGPHDVDHD